jgi:hypothetical protein
MAGRLKPLDLEREKRPGEYADGGGLYLIGKELEFSLLVQGQGALPRWPASSPRSITCARSRFTKHR